MAVTSSDAPAPGDVKDDRRHSPWRTIKWLGGSVMVALAGWTAVEIAQYGFDRLLREHPPPIEAQLRGVLSEAGDDGYRATTNQALDFDGDGSMSRLLILRKRRNLAYADELRIYDVEASRLRLAFRFRPVGEKVTPPLFPSAIPQVRLRPGEPPPFVLHLMNAEDLDGNGSAELILQLIDARFPVLEPVRPFLLAWDFTHEQYGVVPILGPTITGRRGPKLVRKHPFLHRQYQSPHTIIDTHSRSKFVTFGASGFAVRRSQEGPLLAVAFDLEEHWDLRGPPFQVRVWRLYPDDLDAPAAPCRLYGSGEYQGGFIRVPANQTGIHTAIDRVLDRPRLCYG